MSSSITQIGPGIYRLEVKYSYLIFFTHVDTYLLSSLRLAKEKLFTLRCRGMLTVSTTDNEELPSLGEVKSADL